MCKWFVLNWGKADKLSVNKLFYSMSNIYLFPSVFHALSYGPYDTAVLYWSSLS